MSGVLVINADLGPLHQVSLRKAIRMLWRQVAVVHEEVPGTRIGPYPMPKVLRLVTFVVTRWRYTKGPAWSKRGVLARDNRVCGYCEGPANTIDHIQPVSRGGRNVWENTVAACNGCNQRKGDRTPAEAGMRLLARPVIPAWGQLVRR